MTILRNLYAPFPGGRAAIGLLVVRLVAGSALMLHGWPKMQNATTWMGEMMPGWLQALGAFAEFGGGLALVVGLLTPIACFGIACTMATAIGKVHLPKGDSFVASGPGQGSWELAAVYLSIAILVGLAGPGRLSLDYLVFKGQESAGLADERLNRLSSGPGGPAT